MNRNKKIVFYSSSDEGFFNGSNFWNKIWDKKGWKKLKDDGSFK